MNNTIIEKSVVILKAKKFYAELEPDNKLKKGTSTIYRTKEDLILRTENIHLTRDFEHEAKQLELLKKDIDALSKNEASGINFIEWVNSLTHYPELPEMPRGNIDL